MKKGVKITLITVGTVIILGIGGCVASLALVGSAVNNAVNDASKVEKVQTGTAPSAPSKTAPTAPTAPAAPVSFTEGDTAKIDGVEYTLVNAKFVKPNQYSPAKNGKVIQIEVKAKNTSDNKKLVSSIDFNASDAEGNMGEGYYSLQNYGFGVGEVLAGKTLSGNTAFDVKDSASYEVTVKPSFSFGNGEAVFKLTKAQLAN